MAHSGPAFQKDPAAAGGVLSLGMAAIFLGSCLSIGPLSAEDRKPLQLAANSEDLRAEILDLQVSFTGLARRVRNHEAALISAEDTLAKLENEETSQLQELARHRMEHYHTLAALQRIALHPRTAVAVTAAEPVDALRGALLLKAAVPALEDRARELRQALEELDALRNAIEDERQTLAAAASALERRRQDVAYLITRKKGILAVTEAEQERAAARAATLARQAADLRELMALAARGDSEDATNRQGAEASEGSGASGEATQTAGADDVAALPGDQVAALQRPDTIRSFPEQPGNILLPVLGDIVLRYGEQVSSDNGQDTTLKGIRIRTRPGANVIAPFDGKVVFSGDFRSYGQILIIDHGGRYHTLLAGLHRIRAVVGQWVLAGEPVATMNPQANKEPELYLELRRTGQPINPLPWLAEGEQKARG